MNQNSPYWKGHSYFPDFYELKAPEYVLALDNRWEELKKYTEKIDFTKFAKSTPPHEMKETMLGTCNECKGSLMTYSKSEDIDNGWIDISTIGDYNFTAEKITPENIKNFKGKPNFKIEYAYGFCTRCQKTKWSWATIYNRYRTTSFTKDVKSV